jgi:propanediol dehydratase large subunit
MLTEKIKSTLKDAAQKLIGVAKRAFLAQVAIDYFEGSSRKAERVMGRSRKTVEKGLKELETGINCVDNFQARGRKKTEQNLVNLELDIESLISGRGLRKNKIPILYFLW